jgi:signal transduction histidine kinase
MISKQAEQSAELVAALLTLARVSDQEIRKTEVDLLTLTRDVITDATVGETGASAPRFIIGTLPPVHADAALLRSVLTNLISNAVKFCGHRPDGCVEVHGRTDATDTVVQVRDNGIGFSRGSADALFQPFTRLHGQDYAGHGIGLSIARRAIERQGGRVWAEAESGRGASFFFSLPNGAHTPAE